MRPGAGAGRRDSAPPEGANTDPSGAGAAPPEGAPPDDTPSDDAPNEPLAFGQSAPPVPAVPVQLPKGSPAPDGAPPTVTAASGAQPGVRDRLRLEDAEFDICTRALNELGARFTQSAPILDPDPDCGILRPVTLSQPVPGVALDPPAPLRCDAALALARWIKGTVIPAATRLPEGKAGLSAIEHATSYTCRRRNNAATGKLSEHAFGNAIDIFAFRFGPTETLPVKPRAGDGNLRESFQRAVRAGACLEFTTVLGPGTDAAHAQHLHLDVRQRRGGFRLCQ